MGGDANKLATSVPATCAPTTCLTLDNLLDMHDACDADGNPEALRLWAYIAVRVALQARGRDAVDNHWYLRFGHPLPTDGLGASIVLGKTHKRRGRSGRLGSGRTCRRTSAGAARVRRCQ